MPPTEGSFRYNGRRIAFADWGDGERVLVLVHGLLMNRHMYDNLAPEMASRGYRVVTVDLLGHGGSDKPTDMRAYSMSAFADQVAALVDHLELERPIVGGTSLGANAALELAARHPRLARALFIEMPVLDNALVAAERSSCRSWSRCASASPCCAGSRRSRTGSPARTTSSTCCSTGPAGRPRPPRRCSRACFFGRTAPPREERELITLPALVIGHPADPLHPFTDSDMLAEELPRARLVNAESIFEWRVSPGRLDDELAEFIADVYDAEPASSAAGAA